MLGANIRSGGVEFSVWAPRAERLSVQIISVQTNESDQIELSRGTDGLFSGFASAQAGDRYCYVIDGNCRPDPVSRYLPEGVHSRTEIVDPDSFHWNDEDWRGLSFQDFVIYELHTGTFTPQGTFDGAIEKLSYLRDLGITAIELMPVAAFPGIRNWGYDGVSLYAVQARYGGPDGLKRLVNAAHRAGLAVVLDVVYNHLGAEGNYLREVGPYFTDRYKTLWGDAINYDGKDSQHVRKYAIENALFWIREYHIDGLRLDAIQTINDASPKHIVQELVESVREFTDGSGRKVSVMAESDENERKLVLPLGEGGFGLDAVWSDDFHHSVHTVLTAENSGYYQDYGQPEKIVKALNEGFVFQGQHFRAWNTSRGTSSQGIPLFRHVFCIQNHDQIGNRCWGERLNHLVPKGAVKAAAALLLLAPETPLLFMGEEYAEPAPFQFFVDFGDPQLQKAVLEGRKAEFEDFGWTEIPNPQDPETFERSKLTWRMDEDMLAWYRQLLQLRRKFVTHSARTCRARLSDRQIVMEVPVEEAGLLVMVTFPESTSQGTKTDLAGEELLLQSKEDNCEVSVFLNKRAQARAAILKEAA